MDAQYTFGPTAGVEHAGELVGERLGATEGAGLGLLDGRDDGACVGLFEGRFEGVPVGLTTLCRVRVNTVASS